MSLRDLEQAISSLGDTDATQERHRKVLRQILSELTRLDAEVERLRNRTNLPDFDERRMSFVDACQNYVTVQTLNERLEEKKHKQITVRIEPTITINDSSKGADGPR